MQLILSRKFLLHWDFIGLYISHYNTLFVNSVSVLQAHLFCNLLMKTKETWWCLPDCLQTLGLTVIFWSVQVAASVFGIYISGVRHCYVTTYRFTTLSWTKWCKKAVKWRWTFLQPSLGNTAYKVQAWRWRSSQVSWVLCILNLSTIRKPVKSYEYACMTPFFFSLFIYLRLKFI